MPDTETHSLRILCTNYFGFLSVHPQTSLTFFFFKYRTDIVWLAYLSVCWPRADLRMELHSEEGFALMHNPLKGEETGRNSFSDNKCQVWPCIIQ